MKTKNYFIAIAIFGGMLLTSYAATNSLNQDEQQTAKIEKWKIKVPTHG